MLRLGFFLIAAGLAAAAVGTATAATHRLTPGVLRERAAPLRPDVGCTADLTKKLVRTFVGDYNKGRVPTIDRMWAPEPYFQWFSTNAPGRRLGSQAYDRATLSAYFRARVRVHERIVLVKLAAGYDAKRNLVNFGGKLVRSADDLHATRSHLFKGAADCLSSGPALIVWSM